MIYEGDFKEGMRHGKGIWRESNSPNATSYEGSYFNDKKHGEGLYKWKSGSHYKGNFYNDQRDGYGEMYWIDGSSYKGQWEKGAQRGEGLMSFPDRAMRIVETNTSRNYSISHNDLYNSKSFSQSDKKVPKHQRLMSEGSSYTQEEVNPDFKLTQSDQKSRLKIQLINNNQALSTSNGRFRMDPIDETAREIKSTNYKSFMKQKENLHHRIGSRDYPKIPPINQLKSNLDYESGNENKVLVSSHYNSNLRNRSIEVRKSSRLKTGNKSYNSLSRKPDAYHNKSHEITTEPEAVIKILKKKRRKGRGKYFKIRSNSYNNGVLVRKYNSDTRSAYSGIWNSLKKKKFPWRPSGLRDALFNKV